VESVADEKDGEMDVGGVDEENEKELKGKVGKGVVMTGTDLKWRHSTSNISDIC
jgi:hypothetical protein